MIDVASVKISGPSEVRHALHVSADFTWVGEDPAEIFILEKKVGEGYKKFPIKLNPVQSLWNSL